MRDYSDTPADPARAREADADLRLRDAFPDIRPAGRVLGTPSRDGHPRLGADAERRIAIDSGALRFQPLIAHGWGRQGIAYGPFPREEGLLLAVSVTNGHNTSQGSPLPEDIVRRLWRWARGPGADRVPERLRALFSGPRRKGLGRRITGWLRSSRGFNRLPDLDENLAVGWFTTPTPADPLRDGRGFVVHAALGDNGEVWTRVGDGCAPVLRRLMNVRVCYLVLLRERGAVYYIAGGPDGPPGLPGLPMMRPVAVDAFGDEPLLYAGIQQAVIGQIGFRVDTRVHAVEVHRLPAAGRAALGAVRDPLRGEGLPAGWHPVAGGLAETPAGIGPAGTDETLALRDGTEDAGLVHAILATGEEPGPVGIVWGASSGGHLRLELSTGGSRIVRVGSGGVRVIAEDRRGLVPLSRHAVQVSGCGSEVACLLDGARLFGAFVEEPAADGRAGLWFGPGGGTLAESFECHPAAVPMPAGLRLPPPWRHPATRTIAADTFDAAPGPLDGRSVPGQDLAWSRLFGRGHVDVAEGARVRASVAEPNPGRTIHALPWATPGFAEVEAVIRPPGTGRGEREHCRSGVAFWQDADNYITFSVYLADEYDGASIALFPKRHGFEELYDAVWTMVGQRITWGRAFRLRVSFDGNRFVVFIDDQAVLERALTDLYPEDPPLRIEAVGIVSNWEWGDDTGSTFESFTARA